MATISVEAKVFIFIACFLGFWGALIVSMPDSLSAGPTEYIEYEYPEDVFEGIDLTEFYCTENFTFGTVDWETWGKETFGHEMQLLIVNSGGFKYIINNHKYGFFQSHYQHWYNTYGQDRGTKLDLAEIVADHDENNVSAYRVECNHFGMRAWIDYNQTGYSNLEDAWDNNSAYLLFAIDFDQSGTAWSGWTLVAKFMAFQAPNIHPTLNFFLALPIWVSIAVLIVLVIAMLLPFVG